MPSPTHLECLLDSVPVGQSSHWEQSSNIPSPPKPYLVTTLHLCGTRQISNAVGRNLGLSQAFLQSLQTGLIVDAWESPGSESADRVQRSYTVRSLERQVFLTVGTCSLRSRSKNLRNAPVWQLLPYPWTGTLSLLLRKTGRATRETGTRDQHKTCLAASHLWPTLRTHAFLHPGLWPHLERLDALSSSSSGCGFLHKSRQF